MIYDRESEFEYILYATVYVFQFTNHVFFFIADGNMEMEEEMAPLMSKPSMGGAMDFDELLRQARTKIKKPQPKKAAQH